MRIMGAEWDWETGFVDSLSGWMSGWSKPLEKVEARTGEYRAVEQ
jgi:hypothetical protein